MLGQSGMVLRQRRWLQCGEGGAELVSSYESGEEWEETVSLFPSDDRHRLMVRLKLSKTFLEHTYRRTM
jgi:hypothetical protein